jgi:hypothetical protein
MSYQSAPSYEQPLTSKGQTSQSWYRFFQGIYLGTPPSAETVITVGISPFAYLAPAKGFMIVSGGTVSAIQFTRAQTTLTNQTSGIFPLSQGDTLTVTYSGLPSMVWVPQ